MSFDPIQYKTTTRQQWEDAAEAWHRWGPTLETWLSDATRRMLALTGVVAGSRVLDVAAGAGGQSIAAARIVGPNGHVVATDISPTILAYAAKSAAEAGVTNISTMEADGEALDRLAPESFDVALSRVGLIYFPDQQRALTGIRRALKDGGRFGAVVYATADRNQFFSIPVAIIRRRANLPAPQPGQPGPFSLGGAGVLEAALTTAGFRNVIVESVPSPLKLPSAAECVRFERESFGALHQMLSTLSDAERDDVWDEIARELAAFEGDHGFEGPCEMLVAAATR